MVSFPGIPEMSACGAALADRERAEEVSGYEHASDASLVAGVLEDCRAGAEADFGAFVSWLAGGPVGESDHPEHVPLGLDAYPMAAQQGVWSAAPLWSTVVLLTTTFSNGMFSIDSGVMVGRNDVLTDAHVIYEPAWGGFASQVVAMLGAVIGPPFQAPYSASFARITAADTQFDPNGDRLIQAGNRGPGYVGSERDIAFLTLDIPLGDRTGWMALDPGFKQGYANLSGYPAVHRHALTNDTAWAYDDAVDAFTNLFYFEAHPGNSGGPVWHYGGDGRTWSG